MVYLCDNKPPPVIEESMRRLLAITTIFILPALSYAQEYNHSSSRLESVKEHMRLGVEYLKNSQQSETKETEHFAGEWPSYMMNDKKLVMLGDAGKIAYDSNCFTTASIHNALASVYLSYPQEYQQIPPMLKRAIDHVLTFKNGDTFGFWPWMDRPAYAFKKKVPAVLPKVKRPNNYYLESLYILNAANVPDDADDTAVSHLALKLNKQVAKVSGAFTPPSYSKKKIGELFSNYRDRRRVNSHYYNVLNGGKIMTRAFLTWFGKEKVFSPWGWLPIGYKKSYIPYGSNEVDCVVNANVLTTLANFDELDTVGVKKACKFINKAIKKGQFSSCGLYYPNTYNIHYVASKTLEAGVSCLEESEPRLVDHIKSTQLADGSFQMVQQPKWKQAVLKKVNNAGKFLNIEPKTEEARQLHESQKHENNGNWLENLDPHDTVQATVYAISALLHIGQIEKHQTRATIEKGIDFILKNARIDERGANWKGGIFFAGGTLVRYDLNWRSDSYTTALVVELLKYYRQILEKN